jgi:hypothetical protein
LTTNYSRGDSDSNTSGFERIQTSFSGGIALANGA